MNNNMDIYMENHLYLSAPCFVLDEKKLYFSNRSCNALVIVDRETKNVESMVPFEGEELEAKELHLICHRIGNKIYFLPQCKKKLHVYDIERGKQKAYELEGEFEGSPNAFWNFHVWQDKIYLLPCGGGMGLWSIDFEGHLNKESWWNVRAETTDVFFHGTIDEQCFFSLRVLTGEFTITNLKKKETKTYQLPDEQVNGTAYDGQDFWYTSRDKVDIVRWNSEHGEIERYPFPMWDKYSLGGVPYAHICAVGQEIFVVSGTLKELFLLDKENCVLEQVFQVQELSYIQKYEENQKLPALVRIDDKLIWSFWNVNKAAVIDLKTMKGKMYQDVIPINEKVKECFDRALFQKSPLIIENRDDWDLERFLYHCENSV